MGGKAVMGTVEGYYGSFRQIVDIFATLAHMRYRSWIHFCEIRHSGSGIS